MQGCLGVGEMELAGRGFNGRAQNGPVTEAQGDIGGAQRNIAGAGCTGEIELHGAVGKAKRSDKRRGDVAAGTDSEWLPVGEGGTSQGGVYGLDAPVIGPPRSQLLEFGRTVAGRPEARCKEETVGERRGRDDIGAARVVPTRRL